MQNFSTCNLAMPSRLLALALSPGFALALSPAISVTWRARTPPRSASSIRGHIVETHAARASAAAAAATRMRAEACRARRAR